MLLHLHREAAGFFVLHGGCAIAGTDVLTCPFRCPLLQLRLGRAWYFHHGRVEALAQDVLQEGLLKV